jgi:hypothetical protein
MNQGLFFNLIPTNVKMNLYRTIILPVLHGCGTSFSPMGKSIYCGCLQTVCSVQYLELREGHLQDEENA